MNRLYTSISSKTSCLYFNSLKASKQILLFVLFFASPALIQGVYAQTPNMPAGFVCNTPASGSNPGAVFLAAGPNQAGQGDIIYRLFYSETASAPADPTTATEYTFGTTGGDGNGTGPFGFNITGLLINTSYTFWLYEYDMVTMMFSAPSPCTTDSGDVGPPPAPVGCVANTSMPPLAADSNGEVFLALGPISPANPDVVYRLFYSESTSIPADPTTATEYIFGSTGGDGGGTNPFGFILSGLMPNVSYTFFFYQYNTVTMLFSNPCVTSTNSTILPVEWHDPLIATVTENDRVKLDWSVSQEINNEQFVIEYSQDGKEFYAIDHIEGAGNSSRLISYSYLHEDPLQGVNYYRIRQIDYDGQYDFSNISKVIFGGEKPKISLYPNPATSELNINLSKVSMVRIQNHFGSLVRSISLRAGANKIMIEDLPCGFYFLSVDQGPTKRFIKN